MTKKVKKKQKSSKKIVSPLFIFGVLILIFIGGFLLFSVYSFQKSEQEKAGFFTCSQNGKICELSQHIHAEIDLNVCGEKITLPKEKGDLNKAHTHKERNRLHWHERLQVDPVTRKPLDDTPLKISSFLQEVAYEFPNSCGDNSNPIISVTVNNSVVDEALEYTWKDGDDIVVEYK